MSVVPRRPFVLQAPLRHNLDPCGHHTDAALVAALESADLLDALLLRVPEDLPELRDSSMSQQPRPARLRTTAHEDSAMHEVAVVLPHLHVDAEPLLPHLDSDAQPLLPPSPARLPGRLAALLDLQVATCEPPLSQLEVHRLSLARAALAAPQCAPRCYCWECPSHPSLGSAPSLRWQENAPGAPPVFRKLLPYPYANWHPCSHAEPVEMPCRGATCARAVCAEHSASTTSAWACQQRT